MPLYEFKCRKCYEKFEVLYNVGNNITPVTHPCKCGGVGDRAPSTFSIGGSYEDFNQGTLGLDELEPVTLHFTAQGYMRKRDIEMLSKHNKL